MAKTNYLNRLVGHRGLMAKYPENTLVGFRSAIAGGARIIECDIQLTQDLQPVVLHDHGLTRTAGSNEYGTIFDISLTQAQSISVHYPEKFGARFLPEPIASLAQFFALLHCNPEVTAMVELKQESIDQFGLEAFLQAVFPLAQASKKQLIIISFNAEVIVAAKQAGFVAGWVIESMNDASQQLAGQLLPQYLITDVLEVDVNAPKLWIAPSGHQWQWMLYDVVDPKLAKALMDQGVDLIETADLIELSAQL